MTCDQITARLGLNYHPEHSEKFVSSSLFHSRFSQWNKNSNFHSSFIVYVFSVRLGIYITAVTKHTYYNRYQFNIAILVISKHIEQQNCKTVQKCSNSNKNIEFWCGIVVSIEICCCRSIVIVTQMHWERFFIQSANNHTLILGSLFHLK